MTPSDRPPDATRPETISVLLVGASELQEPLSAAAPDDAEFLVTGATRGREAYQWLTTQPGRVDCLVCANELPETSGVSLLESVREIDPDLPVILLAADGSEATASRAISADVTEYLAVDDGLSSIEFDALYERIQRAVADERSRHSLRRRARQFDSLLGADDRYLWVLDPDGTVRETNRAVTDGSGGDPVPDRSGGPFWERPWWNASQNDHERVREGVQTALAGRTARFELQVSVGEAETATLDVTMRPVFDASGAVERVIVEGIDISERVELETELRESEQLHRVTLNNMTDTVLVTDDEGEFTYICPNIHFIFGYSVEEIEEMGSIDALLGEELFDPAELESEGVLTNIETTATDRAGREHTLLVNVRTVSIQGGTTLYSCRDITKRKEREEALTALHRTSRELLYAETPQEIARQISDDVVDLLDVPGSAVYLFDSDENALRPAASSDGMAGLHGPLASIDPGADSIVGYTFVEQTAKSYGDVHDSPRLYDPATDVRSAIVIPLGTHGVVVVASDETDIFDEITEEIADLLAATAEAALDRVERETKLRERDREMQRQNQQLTQLNRTNEIIRDIDQLLVNADSRTEIEHAVCDRLTADSRFALAWIGAVDEESGTLEPRAWAGSTHGYLDAVDLALSDGASEPSVRTADSTDPTVVSNIGEDLRAGGWRKAALSRGYQSVASVPLVYDGFSFGVLSVYADHADVFDEMTRMVLHELGETIASAIQSAERKTAFMSNTITELEYRITDSRCVLYTLAERADCTVTLNGGAHPSEEGTRVLVSVDGSVEEFVSAATEMVAVEGVRRIVTSETDSLLRLTITTPFIGTELSNHGAVLRSFTATPTAATMLVDVPQTVDTYEINTFVTDRYPESEISAQRERDRSLMTEQQFRAAFLDTITDRQLEVVQTAHLSGYFASPRQNSGEEIAETLDISSSAFYKHLRNVQGKLFATLFEQTEPVTIKQG